MSNPYDDYCDDDTSIPFVSGRPSVAPARQQPKPVVASKVAQRAGVLNYLSLLCQGLDIVTEVSVPVAGDEVQDTYTELYKNNTNNPIRVQVFAELVVPGCGANLSTSNNGADSDKYDVLSLTANGRTESVGIVLLPTMSIWMRNFNTAIPMTAADILRVRIFDPMKLLSYAALYPELKGT